ncbi:sodium:proton antiporter [soil metagenome]
MTLYATFSALIVLAAVFAYINLRFIKLPPVIGLMLLALITSLLMFAIGAIYPPALQGATALLSTIDFSELLLGSMLSFMLFAGAIHIKLEVLKKEKVSVILYATISTIISTFIIGIAVYYLLILFHVQVPFIYCLLFGSLISPTDPIAVLGILKGSKISKSLEMIISGESLFNDGIAVVIFLTILQVAEAPADFKFGDVLLLFGQEAFGGLFLGIVLGYICFILMRKIDNYKVEVLMTIAVVMGGYAFASIIHVSGPLAIVAAGIIIGNHGKDGMSDRTIQYLDKFWELIDETLNAILFVLIGLQLLLVTLHPQYLLIGMITIVVLLITRYISLLIPSKGIMMRENISHKTIFIMTWGGLRGGISIALALSLKPFMEKDLWVTLTFVIVAFSILVQGLTVGKVAKKLKVSS